MSSAATSLRRVEHVEGSNGGEYENWVRAVMTELPSFHKALRNVENWDKSILARERETRALYDTMTSLAGAIDDLESEFSAAENETNDLAEEVAAAEAKLHKLVESRTHGQRGIEMAAEREKNYRLVENLRLQLRDTEEELEVLSQDVNLLCGGDVDRRMLVQEINEQRETLSWLLERMPEALSKAASAGRYGSE